MPISIQFRDEFVGTAGVEIVGRVPDVGANWSTSQNFFSGGWRTSGTGIAEPRKLNPNDGQLKIAGWIGSDAKAYPLDTSSGLSIEATILHTTTLANLSTSVGVGSRDSGTTQALVLMEHFSGSLTVRAFMSLAHGIVAFARVTVSIATLYRLRLEWAGSSAQFFIDDILQETKGTPDPCPSNTDAVPTMSWGESSFTTLIRQEVHRVEFKALPAKPVPLDLILFRDTFTGSGEPIDQHVPDISPWGYHWSFASGVTCGPGEVSSTFASVGGGGFHSTPFGIRLAFAFTLLEGSFQVVCSPVNCTVSVDFFTGLIRLGVSVSYPASNLFLPSIVINAGTHDVVVIVSGPLAKYYLDGVLIARGVIPAGPFQVFDVAQSFFLSASTLPTSISFFELSTFDKYQVEADYWQNFAETFELIT
jgi:hypothetical protein